MKIKYLHFRMKTPGLIVCLLFFGYAMGQNTTLTMPQTPPVGLITPTVIDPGVSPFLTNPVELRMPEVVNPGLYDPVLLTPVIPVTPVYNPYLTQESKPNSLQNRESSKRNCLQNHSSGKTRYSSNMFASPYKKQ